MKTMVINVEPWFVGNDVAMMLGYAKPLNAVAMHVEIEDSLKQGLLDSNGNTQQTIFINESGLSSLILSSKLPQAKEFKRWVTSEVLPQIKKVGGYIPINSCNLVLWFYSSIIFTHTYTNYSLRLIKLKQVIIIRKLIKQKQVFELTLTYM